MTEQREFAINCFIEQQELLLLNPFLLSNKGNLYYILNKAINVLEFCNYNKERSIFMVKNFIECGGYSGSDKDREEIILLINKPYLRRVLIKMYENKELSRWD